MSLVSWCIPLYLYFDSVVHSDHESSWWKPNMEDLWIFFNKFIVISRENGSYVNWKNSSYYNCHGKCMKKTEHRLPVHQCLVTPKHLLGRNIHEVRILLHWIHWEFFLKTSLRQLDQVPVEPPRVNGSC